MPTAIIYADKDSYISQQQGAAPASGYASPDGVDSSIRVYSSMFTGVYGHTDATTDTDGLVSFPGSVPAGAIISAATLNLKTKSDPAGVTIGVVAAADFDENAVNWNSYAHGSGNKSQSNYVNGHPPYVTGVTPAAQSWFVVNVLGAIVGATRRAFLLYSTGDTVNYSAEKSSYAQVDFHSSEASTPANRPYLSVTYSEAPGAPGSISTPAAGSTHDQSINLFAGAASDPDTPAGSLQYEWSYQLNGGAWTVIPGLTAAGTTAKVWNTAALAQGTTYKVRLRAWDGSQWGPYTTMAGTFSIIHTAQVKIWNGAAWVLKNLYRWNGAAWVATKLKRWNGSTWITE